MFTVSVYKTVWVTGNHSTTSNPVLEVRFSLPFAPYPGLRVQNDTELDVAIEMVWWNLTDSEFHCEAPPVHTFGPLSQRDASVEIRDLLDEGWSWQYKPDWWPVEEESAV